MGREDNVRVFQDTERVIKSNKRLLACVKESTNNQILIPNYMQVSEFMLGAVKQYEKPGSIIFLMGLAPNVLGYRHPAAILDRSKNKCCGLITDGEELKNNQLCFSVDTTVLHLFSDLSRTCPRTSGGWVPPLALTPKNNRSVSFLVA